MKKILTWVCCMVVVCTLTKAQEFKLAKSTGRLEIKEVNHLEIEGYDGKEIVFTATGGRERNERAKGLRVVNGLGLEDNTGIGLSVVDKGETVEVRQMKKMDGPDVTIKVPKGMVVSYSHSSPYGSDVKFSNLDNKIEVSTLHNGIHLTNVTGPLSITSVHGEIEATFKEALKNDVSLKSTHGPVDISLPIAAPSTLRMETKFGNVYVDPDFKLALDSDGRMTKYSGDVRGKINGGGSEIDLESTHNDVYLRKN